MEAEHEACYLDFGGDWRSSCKELQLVNVVRRGHPQGSGRRRASCSGTTMAMLEMTEIMRCSTGGEGGALSRPGMTVTTQVRRGIPKQLIKAAEATKAT
jgi:hypothetical protein